MNARSNEQGAIARRRGTMHTVMSALEFVQRQAALVPCARLHLTRLRGVFAPHAELAGRDRAGHR